MRALRVPAVVLAALSLLLAAYLILRDDATPLLPGGTLETPAETENGFRLEQNQPNPFRDLTALIYQIPARERVRLEIYNTLGVPVITLVDEIQEPGFHEVEWDGRDANGNRLPGGVYFYQLTAGEKRELRRMVMLP